MTAIAASHPCEAVMEDAAIEVSVNHLFDIGPEKAVFGCEPLVIDLLQRFEVILNTLIILRLLWLAGLVGRGYVGHLRSPEKLEGLPNS